MSIRNCIVAAIMVVAANQVHAQDAKSLEACLVAFDGIQWSLPYSPRLSAGNCHHEGNSADIEFFIHEVLDADARSLDYDSRYAADKKALFAFFEQLFRRHGYQLGTTETDDDARVPYVQRAAFQRSNGDVIEYMASSNVCRLKLKKAGRP
ncbi:MAG: hypothetical protein REI12_02965 [Pedobacter sp.]|nr:hypothetical protein [Pedobacter sp.]